MLAKFEPPEVFELGYKPVGSWWAGCKRREVSCSLESHCHCLQPKDKNTHLGTQTNRHKTGVNTNRDITVIIIDIDAGGFKWIVEVRRHGWGVAKSVAKNKKAQQSKTN
jgi:hypothetical protein